MTGAHLLIVDDEENLRSMLAAALRHHGFEVTPQRTGAMHSTPWTTSLRTSSSST